MLNTATNSIDSNKALYLHVLNILKLQQQQLELVVLMYEERVRAIVEYIAVEGGSAVLHPLAVQVYRGGDRVVVEQVLRDNLLLHVALVQPE